METSTRGVLGRWVVVALVGVGLSVGLGVVAVGVMLPKIVYSRVLEAARASGIELQVCEGFEFEREGLEVTHVTLVRCRFTSALPMQPTGSVEQVDVDLKGNVPTRVTVVRPDVKVVGEQRFLALRGALSTPSEAELLLQGGRVAWVQTEGTAPLALLENVQRLGSADPWSADVSLGVDITGRFVFGKELSLNLAQRENANNTVRLNVDPARFTGTLNVELEGLPMTLLSGVVFHNVPPELLTVQLSGNAAFDLSFGLNPKQSKGRFKFTFQGLNFPVPREVAGLVYDTSPEIQGDVQINRTFSQSKVDNFKFATGSLLMKGSATVDREGAQTRWRSSLKGPLPCDAIAAAAAKIHLKGLPLGAELAQTAARISKQALKGSVEIFVALDAHSSDLAAAKLIKTIGVGCGLKPLPLVGVAQDLLNDLPEFTLNPASLSDMVKELPSLADLPKLPRLPGLQTPKRATGTQTPDKDE